MPCGIAFYSLVMKKGAESVEQSKEEGEERGKSQQICQRVATVSAHFVGAGWRSTLPVGVEGERHAVLTANLLPK